MTQVMIETAADRLAGAASATYVKGLNVVFPTAGIANSFAQVATTGATQYHSYMQLTPAAYFSSAITSGFSISFWINLQAACAGICRILDFATTTTTAAAVPSVKNSGFAVALAAVGDNNALTFEVITAAGVGATYIDPAPTVAPLITAVVGFTTANWRHVTITGTTGTTLAVTIYINGATKGTITAVAVNGGTAPTSSAQMTSLAATTFTNVFIGAGYSRAAVVAETNINALINDVKIYSVALTASQVLTNYNTETAARLYTCSSTSISPQYFYIALLAMLGAFL